MTSVTAKRRGAPFRELDALIGGIAAGSDGIRYEPGSVSNAFNASTAPEVANTRSRRPHLAEPANQRGEERGGRTYPGRRTDQFGSVVQQQAKVLHFLT